MKKKLESFESFNPMDELKASIEKNINETEVTKNKLNSLESSAISNNPLIYKIDKLEKIANFEKIRLSPWDILFEEWDIDNNLYIIKSWHLSIEKYTTVEKTNKKQLAVLKRWDFLWEWALKNSKPKEVRVVCLKESEVLSIEAKSGFQEFIKNHPEEWLEILTHIIETTNARLLEANKIISANHELNNTINSIDEYNYKNIFFIVDKIKSIIDCEYILYFEKHKVLENFLTLKYDSRLPWKMQDKVFEKKWAFLDLQEVYSEAWVDEKDYLIFHKVGIWKEVLWYLLLWRERRMFRDNEKKLVSSTASSLAWVIKQFIHKQEDRDKVYISEMNK